MNTYYLLFDTYSRQFAKRGTRPALTPSLNWAKHFTSKWSAEQWQKKSDMFETCIIKRIETY